MLWGILLAVIKVVVIIVGVYLMLAAFMVWGERKWSSLAQNRPGPNRAFVPLGSFKLVLNGLIQVLADSLKMIFKEDVNPSKVSKLLFTLAPCIAFFVVFAAVPVIVPFTGFLNFGRYDNVALFERIDLTNFSLQVANPNVGILFILAIAALAPYASIIGGWASDNKYGLIGSLRTTNQVISYEVALGLSLVGLFMIAGSLQPIELVEMQTGTFLGFLPKWGIFMQPLAFFIFFAAAYAESKRAPFDLPEGESEIVAGYFIEYSGMKFGMFYLSEFAEQVTMAAMLVTLFLGGYHFPYMTDGAYTTIATPLIIAFCATFMWLFAISVLRSRLYGLFTWGSAAVVFGFSLLVFGYINGNFAALAEGVALKTALFGDATMFEGFMYGAEICKGLAQSGTFIAKLIMTIWFLVLVRWSYPRFRYDQVMKLGWKMLLPLALLNVLITGIIILAI